MFSLMDILVVFGGTYLAYRVLKQNPVMLIGYLPAALSLSFFVPFVTLLTLWQTVPTLLLVRLIWQWGVHVDFRTKVPLLFLFFLLIVSAFYALYFGDDPLRGGIRLLNYLGIFSLFCFCYEMARRPDCYEIFLKGLVITGIVFSLYGIYQIVAVKAGLPVRLISRAGGRSDVGLEAGFLRINSLATEPKRLGYVLFVCGMASFFLSQLNGKRPSKFKLKSANNKNISFVNYFRSKISDKLRSKIFDKPRNLNLIGYGVLITSIFTFSGSYFLACVIFLACLLFLYPIKLLLYSVSTFVIISLLIVFFPNSKIVSAVEHGYERRKVEVTLGVDGVKVYRQELFAQDYLDRYPETYILGFGLGQYYTELNQEYGSVAGKNSFGGLTPMNSNLIELLFDFGGLFVIVFYGSMLLLVIRLRLKKDTFLCMAIAFLVIQSTYILTLPYMVVFAGIAAGRLSKNARVKNPRTLSRVSGYSRPTVLDIQL